MLNDCAEIPEALASWGSSRYEDIAEEMLLNATDYIGNRPEMFDADNRDLRFMRNNTEFRQYVAGEVEDCPEEYDGLSQEEAAETVWSMYQDYIND